MLRPYTSMSKKIIAAQLDSSVFDDAQRLIEAGHFDSLDALLNAALRTFVLKYAQGPASLVDCKQKYEKGNRRLEVRGRSSDG